MRGSPDLGRDGANLQDTGQRMLSSGGRLQFGPGLGGSLEESEKESSGKAAPPPMGLLRAPGHRAAPRGASVPSHPGHQRPKEGARGWREQLRPHCRPRVAAGPESHTIRKEVSTAQSSQNTKKTQNQGQGAGPAPQPTQGVPRRIYVQRVLDRREGEQKALTPKPAWGRDPEIPVGRGRAGPGGSRSCRTDGEGEK